jgi:diacylglycerol kinase family enzyme
MNAQFLGRWDVAPRSHPADGRFDVLDADPGFGDRWKARSRLPQGLHVPHPDIAERRTAAEQIHLEPPLRAWLDGVVMGLVRDVVVRVEPDAVVVVV